MTLLNHHQEPYPLGVIHGRFQVLHNDHLKYLLAGKSRCRELVIAITNPDPSLSSMESVDCNRSQPVANPLTYYERYRLVKDAMTGAGQDLHSYCIVPLPISMPEMYQFYVPLNAVFFLTIYDDWGRRKQAYFQSLGLKTEILWDIPLSEKGISGSHVRQLMLESKDWESLVPPSVASLLRKWRIPERIRNLTASQGTPE